ncbi:MAG: hypothetical protein AAGA30_07310 [Planctomycetota bacterium]
MKNKQIEKMLAELHTAKQTPPELLEWASGVDLQLIVKLAQLADETGITLGELAIHLLSFTETCEEHGIEEVKKALVVGEYLNVG